MSNTLQLLVYSKKSESEGGKGGNSILDGNKVAGVYSQRCGSERAAPLSSNQEGRRGEGKGGDPSKGKMK